MGRPLLFYSAWPLGYHNLEAERKARGFAAAGYDTVYVAGVGIRNPRLRTLPKAVDRIARGMLGRDGPAGSPVVADGLRSGSVLVVPPRQVGSVRRTNARWIGRRLTEMVGPGAVAWIRWPTPELVDALATADLAAVVYECVDAYHHTPGITGPWAARHEQAERALVDRADAVVVPSEHLAERFRASAGRVAVVPHGVTLEAFPFAAPREDRSRPVVGFVGTLDYKLDLGFLRHVAERRTDWSIRLIGPIQEGFDPAALADLRNVSVEPAIPYERVGAAIAGFDASMMPYRDDPVYRSSTPLKNLEIMAVGRPAVARPTRALEAYSDVIELATTPEAFLAGLDRVLAADSNDLARRRRARAEQESWRLRMDELLGLLEALKAGPDAADAPLDRPQSIADAR
ncbi:MAG TPA: glycosyltransferase [Solirubrobacteraceae bacterium]|nr:glycosyltransferase [Solirubrobacteraceae bacterium]